MLVKDPDLILIGKVIPAEEGVKGPYGPLREDDEACWEDDEAWWEDDEGFIS